MENIIGLTKILNTINKITNLPHSFVLEGAQGSGRHLILNYINEKFFEFDYLDITEDLSEETITNIYLCPQKKLYVVDTSKITQKEQNILLKILEEPFENIYICLLVINSIFLLPTIKNRTIIYKLDTYTKEELLKVASINQIEVKDEHIRKYLLTPGDILRLKTNNININNIEELADKIVEKIKLASFPNTLSLIDKINYKDEYDKIDLYLLLRVLYVKYIEKYISTKESIYEECFSKVLKTSSSLIMDQRLDKKKKFTHLLVSLWEINHAIKRT